MPPENIKTLQAQFRYAAKRKYIPGAPNNSSTLETTNNGFTTIRIPIIYFFYVSKEKPNRSAFPLTYEILVLEDTRGAPTYEWEHPTFYGAAIDVSASEIVYFAQGR
ncbi:MAG: hypothetical protein MUD14_01525 [Hydrococcus sp. Prado102]|nr:hypothetical protein [Hydrococcus sp. Prado102]